MRTFLFILIIITFSFNKAFSYTLPVDSVKVYDSLFKISQLTEEKVLILTKYRIKEAQINNSKINEGKALYNYGLYLAIKGKNSEALIELEKALILYTEINYTIGIAGTHNVLGSINSSINNPTEAIKHFKISKSYLINSNQLKKTSYCMNNIALEYTHLKKYKSAIDEYHNIIELYKKNKLSQELGNVYNNLGILYSSIVYNNFNYTPTLFSDLKDSITIAHLLLDSALNYQILALKTVDTSNKSILANIYYGISGTYLAKEDFYKALEYALLCEKTTSQTQELGLQLKNYHSLADIYEGLHKYDSALHWLNEHLKLYKTSINETEIFDTGKAISDIENTHEQQLLKQQQIIKLQEKEAILFKRTVFFIFIIIIVSITFIFYYFKSQIKKQREYIKGQLNGEESERKRLAMELHDDIGQELTLLKHKIKKAEQPQLISSMDRAIHSIRSLSKKIYPASLSSLGFIGAINELIKDAEKASNLNITYDIDKKVNHLMNQNEQLHFYRVFQECINNTIKHAEATAIRITGFESNKQVEFNYLDNGKGIINKKRSGLGLYNIDNRMKSINANWKINNQENGTSLNFTLNKRDNEY